MKRKITSTLIISVVLLLVINTPITKIFAATKVTTVSNAQELNDAIINTIEDEEFILAEDFEQGDLSIIIPSTNVVINGSKVISWKKGIFHVSGDNDGSITLKNFSIDGSNIGDRIFTIVHSKGTLNFQNVEIFNSEHGAMLIDTTKDAITNLKKAYIHDNMATNTAPALWIGEYTYIVIEYSTFENNMGIGVDSEVGAISSKDFSGEINIQNSVFRNNKNRSINTGIGGGGGGAMTINFFKGTINIDESIFDGNQSSGEGMDVQSTYDGGAIYIFDGKNGAAFNVDKTTFSNNIAYDDGGAMFIQGTGNPGLTTTVTNSTFYNNKAYGLYEDNHAGGAIHFLKNGGSSKMNNNIVSSTFVGNQGGSENSTRDQRGGAISLSGHGILSVASITRIGSLFIGNRVYNKHGELDVTNRYKDISNNSTIQSGTSNVVNVDSGLEPMKTVKDVLGNNTAKLHDNGSNVRAGYLNEIVQTIPIKPEGIADNTYIGTSPIPFVDQQHNTRYKDQGAVEKSWIKYHANGGEFKLNPLQEYDGTEYYEVESKIETSDGIEKEVTSINTYYDISFIEDIGSVKAAADFNLVREGYILKGWSTTIDEESDPFFVPGQSIEFDAYNLNLFAVWEKVIEPEPVIEHTVTYTDGVGHSVFADENILAKEGDETPTYNKPIKRDGYTFEGWLPEIAPTVIEDVTYIAQWKINRYTISYETNGGTSVNSETVDYNTPFTAPIDPTKAGYTFKGWYTHEELTQVYDFSTPAIGDITLYAHWEEEWTSVQEYTVTYTDGVGSEEIFTDQIITVNAGAATPEFVGSFEREGYSFVGWNPELSATVTDHVIYTAQWEKIEEQLNPTEPIEPEKPTITQPNKPTLPSTGVANDGTGLYFILIGGVIILLNRMMNVKKRRNNQ